MEDFDQALSCSVCLSLFADPVTTPCGHTFCRSCLAQTFASEPDSSSTGGRAFTGRFAPRRRAVRATRGCPLCRRPIYGVSSTNVALQEVVESLRASRGQNPRQMSTSSVASVATAVPTSLGVFVLPNVLLCPGKLVFLNVFEPRYLELMRRCLTTGVVFGMQPSETPGYGCTLRITSAQENASFMFVECVVETRYLCSSHLEIDAQGVYVASDALAIVDEPASSTTEIDRLALRVRDAFLLAASELSDSETRRFEEMYVTSFFFSSSASAPPKDSSKLSFFCLAAVSGASSSSSSREARQRLVYSKSVEERLEGCMRLLKSPDDTTTSSSMFSGTRPTPRRGKFVLELFSNEFAYSESRGYLGHVAMAIKVSVLAFGVYWFSQHRIDAPIES